jgi:hypothetical protein
MLLHRAPLTARPADRSPELERQAGVVEADRERVANAAR